MKRLCLALLFASSAVHAQQECIPPAQMQVVANQRNAAQDQIAQVIAQANAEIEKLRKELDAAKAPKK